jgi:hypothetical protein
LSDKWWSVAEFRGTRPLTYFRRAIRRCVIWSLALLVAWFVPLHTAGWPFGIVAWMHRVEASHKLQDAFLAVVAMVVLSGSDFFDIVFPKPGAVVSRWGQRYGYLVLFVYFVFILFGMAQFDSLEKLSGEDTMQYWLTMLPLLILGFLGELVIAGEPV